MVQVVIKICSDKIVLSYHKPYTLKKCSPLQRVEPAHILNIIPST